MHKLEGARQLFDRHDFLALLLCIALFTFSMYAGVYISISNFDSFLGYLLSGFS